MALTGARDLSSLVMMTGWDATALQKFKLQDGSNYDQVVSELNAGLAALNAELASDALWSSLVSFTDMPDVDYNVGTNSEMDNFTEWSRGDADRAEMEGHMLPLLKKERALGWTWSYLKEARLSHLRNDIRNGLDAVRTTYRKTILTRLLQRGDDSGASKGLGTSGLSPGFATTAASTGVDFTPPQYAGNSFDSTHEHYVGIAGGVFTAAVFTDAKDELREHGHEPPYDFIIGKSDEAAVKALTGFVKVEESLVAYGQNTDLAKLPVLSGGKSYYVGTLNDFAIRVVPGIPQYYGFGWKSYGPNSPMNPLKMRLEKGMTAPRVIAMPDPRGGSGASPLVKLILYLELGAGVRDRTGGTARYVNNTTWADGTAS